MANLKDFLKENVTGAAVTAAVFGPDVVKSLQEGESKFAVIGRLIASLYFWSIKWLQPLRAALIGGWMILGFKAVGDAIRNIVRESGSLDAALKRLQTIQFTTKQFAPFLGGMSAARQRVSELLALSARGPFKFEEVAGASRSLEARTHGAFSSAEATRKVGASAIASGNNIGDVADAVGSLYQSLRAGAPIEAEVEQLRQLGTVSQETAVNLVAMSKSGATGDDVFNRFAASIKTSSEEIEDDLGTVTAEHAKAVEELQKRFGEPWTQSEIQNTKNMTAAMQAIAPTVGRVSQTFATLFNGFQTVRTGLIAMVAKSSGAKAVLEGLAGGLATVASAAVLVGTILSGLLVPKLFLAGTAIQSFLVASLRWLGVSLATSTVLATRFAGAVKLLSIAGASGIALAGVAALGGAIYNMYESLRQTYREADQLTASFAKSNRAIREQIDSVKSLTEHHDALAASMNQVLSAHSALIEARAKDKAEATGFTINPLQQVVQGVRAVEELTGIGGPRTRAAAKAEKDAERNLRAASTQRTDGLPGPEREKVLEQRAQEAEQEQLQQFERRLIGASPRQRIEIQREQAQFLQQRSASGKAGLLERQRVAERTSEIEGGRAIIQKRVEIAQQNLAAEQSAEATEPADYRRPRRIAALKKQIEKDNKELVQADAAALRVRLSKSSEGTAIGEFAKEELLLHKIKAGDAEEEIRRTPAPQTEEEKEQLKETSRRFKAEKTMAGGEVIRGAPERAAAVAQMQVLRVQGEILQKKEQQATADAENAKMLETQADEDQRVYEINLRRAEAEREISELGGVGIVQAETTYRVNKALIDTELQAEGERAKKRGGRPDEVRIQEFEERKAESENTIDSARREYALTVRRAQAEEEIGSLKGTVLERAEGEYQITRQLLDDEAKAERERASAVYERRKERIDTRLAREKAKPVEEQRPEVIKRLEEAQALNTPEGDLDKVRMAEIRGEKNRRELAIETVRREYDLTLLRASTEERIANLKGSVIEKAEGEYALNREALATELRSEHEEAQAQYEIRKRQLTDLLGEETAKPLPEQKPEDIANLQRQLAENKPEPNQDRIRQIEAEQARQDFGIDTTRREYGLTLARVEAERQIAGLRGTAAERAEAEYQIRRRLLAQELAVEEEKARNQSKIRGEELKRELEQEKAKPTPDQGAIEKLQTDILTNKPVVDTERVTQIQTELTKDSVARLDRLRTQQVARAQQDIELASHAARRSGRTQQALSLEDLESFGRHFEENRQLFGEAEARRRAFLQTRDEIAQEGYKPGGLKAVVDSLQRIGGGGGAYTPGGDPRLQVAKRQAVLLESIDRYMKLIAGKEGGVY